MRNRYGTFRELLSLNDECLEILASIQEDLQYTTAREEVLADRVASIFDRTDRVVEALGTLTARDHPLLARAARAQRREVERFLVASRARPTPGLAASLSDVDVSSAEEVGSKAAFLGEVKNRLRLPVPDGFALTAEAYRQFCETPLWIRIRNATRPADLGDLEALQEIAAHLTGRVMDLPVPRELEVAITEGARALGASAGLAVRSSAVGEGEERTFAGQFLSLLSVPPDQAVDAYRRVVASRFSDRALSYRLSGGLTEVDSPMAVLVLPFIRARASGVLYTRDPSAPKGETLWVSAARGSASGIADRGLAGRPVRGGRGRGHRVIEQRIATKGICSCRGREAADRRAGDESAPSLSVDELALLADRGAAIERHFGVPHDVEWAFDESGELWILQSRPLAMVDSSAARDKSRVREDPLLSGGRSVFPGRTSGPVHFVADPRGLGATPDGAVLFLRRASPEIVEVFPRIVGLVAEWGNPTGHAAALLREFEIPSVFQMTGGFERLTDGDLVSLDATLARVYSGALWPSRLPASRSGVRRRGTPKDPVSDRLLALHLLDPASFGFRPANCRSAHDVLRFCHEKAIEAMFVANDSELERDVQCSKRLLTPAPGRPARPRSRRRSRAGGEGGHRGHSVADPLPALPGPLAGRLPSRRELDSRDAGEPHRPGVGHGDVTGSPERRDARARREELPAGGRRVHEPQLPAGLPLHPRRRVRLRHAGPQLRLVPLRRRRSGARPAGPARPVRRGLPRPSRLPGRKARRPGQRVDPQGTRRADRGEPRPARAA